MQKHILKGADAAIGNVQEKEMKLYKASNIEVVLYSYSIGFVYILIGEIFFGRIIQAINFWLHVCFFYIYANISLFD